MTENFLACVAWLTVLSATLSAAETFHFVSDGEVIASLTVDITGMTAELTDIGPLTFTDRGNELFGFGSVYPGSFDVIGPENFPLFTIGSDGGLGGNNADNVQLIRIRDLNRPASSVWGKLQPGPLAGFGIRAAESGFDAISFSYIDPISMERLGFLVEGYFLPVPEPGMSLWCVLPLTAAVASARRRRTRTNRR